MKNVEKYIKSKDIKSEYHRNVCEQIIKTTRYSDAAKNIGISRQRAYQIWKEYFDETPKEVVVSLINNK